MKLVLIITSFLFIGHNAYNKVGVERFCNIDPSEFTAQCNYESLSNCQAYMLPGQRCIPNSEYHPQSHDVSPATSAFDEQPSRSLVALWQQQPVSQSWVERIIYFFQQINQRIKRWYADLYSHRS